MTTTKKLYEIDHDYYCSEANYYDHRCTWEYDSWDEFYEEHKDDDIDLNLIFRWDWHYYEDTKQSILQLSVMRQRLGIFGCCLITVTHDDEPKIKEFLKPYARYMAKLWEHVDESIN